MVATIKELPWNVELEERSGLTEQLKSELEEASPLTEASMFSDLLNAALSEVDWREIAEAFLEEVEAEPSDQAEEEG